MECRISFSVALARQIYKEMDIYNLGFQHVFVGFIHMVFLQEDVHGQKYTGTTQSSRNQ